MKVQIVDGSDRPREMRIVRTAASFWLFAAAVSILCALSIEDGDLSNRLREGAKIALYGGTAMTVIMFGMHYILGLLVGHRRPVAVVQTARVRVACDLASATRVANEALSTLTLESIRHARSGKLSMVTTTPMSVGSWGERLEVRVTPVAPSESIVQITSSPRIRLAVVDYGKAAGNVKRFVAALRRCAESEESPSGRASDGDSIFPEPS